MSASTNSTSTRGAAPEAILDAAEVVFGNAGFHGATTRAISDLAQTNSALIHYYFGSKDALYQAVVARRATVINDERMALLDALHAQGQPSLEQLLDALMRPTIALGRDPERGGIHFSKLLALGVADSNERTQEMTKRHYDTIALRFIDEFQSALPGLDRAAAARSYLNASGIAISLMVPNSRADTLSNGTLDEDDLEQTLEYAIRFIAAGTRALAAPTEPD